MDNANFVTTMLMDISKQQELRGSESLETKSVAIMALLPVLVGLFTLVDHSWLAIGPLGTSVAPIICGMKTVTVDEYYVGPNNVEFFDQYRRETVDESQFGMLCQLTQAIGSNNHTLISKGRAFTKELSWMLISVGLMIGILMMEIHFGKEPQSWLSKKMARIGMEIGRILART